MNLFPTMSFRRKPGAPKHLNVITLPLGKHTGILKDSIVEIVNEDSVKDLQDNGCYGTKISQTSEDGKDVLIISKEEAFFLHFYLKCLTILKDGQVLSTENLFEHFRVSKRDFISTFIAYCYLKSKGWVIKSGLKFAGDFLLYKEGPHAYHSSYVVTVEDDNPEGEQEKMTGRDLQRFHRVAEASGKEMLIITVNYPLGFKGEDFKWQDDAFENFSIAEMRPMRFTFNPNTI